MKFEAEIGGTRNEVEIDARAGRFRAVVGGRVYEGELLRTEPDAFTFFLGARVVEVRVGRLAGSEILRVKVNGSTADVRVIDRKHLHGAGDAALEGRQVLAAPMPGKVVAVLVERGASVARGEGIVVVEAMKMQNEVKASKDGVVAELLVAAGDTVNAGQTLAIVE
jgi:biotin carboxyl carrier protein